MIIEPWSVITDSIARHWHQQRIVASWFSLATTLLPVVLGYYVMAVLVQLPTTKLFRLALLPPLLWLIVIASVTLDFSCARPEYAYHNLIFALSMFVMAMRVTTWSFANEPYIKVCDTEKVSQNSNVKNMNSKRSDDIRNAMWNVCDLCCNLRGLGWNWSKGVHIPRPMFKVESRLAFAALCLVRFLLYTTALSAVDLFTKGYAPEGSDGWSIFDPSLPPRLRYLRSSILTIVAGFAVWMMVELMYQLLAVIFTLLFRQHPSQWPPLFDRPWFATSLSRFWARCWHQIVREWLVAIGSRPLEPFLGSHAPIGAFVLSAIFHHIGVRGMDRGGDILGVGGYFVMHGVGVALERLFKRLTGRRVGGFGGWLWMWTWQIIWGSPLVDAMARKGVIARSEFFFESWNPAVFILNTLQWIWETRTQQTVI